MPRVLVVDDSEDLLEIYQALLELKGYDVAVAIDGESGLERVIEFRPDVVLLDMMMPGLDGLGFLGRLPAVGTAPLPRVIANSGFDGYRAEAMNRGAHTFLRKPVSSDVLLAAIAAAVPGKQVSEERLAENEQHVDASRQRSREAAARLITRLRDERMREIHACLEALVEWLRRYYGFGECFLHLVHGDNVYLEASSGTDTRFLAPGMSYPRRNLFCDDVIDVGSTLYLTDPLRHPVPEFAHHNEVRRRGWHFYIGAPLATSAGTVLGTLCLMDRTPHQMYAEDVRLFEVLAAHVAAMLEQVADGRSVEATIVNSERVFDHKGLDLVLCTGLRRITRTRGTLQLAKFRLRDRQDVTAVVRKMYGLTSGLRFAVAVGAGDDEWALLHDGSDPDIVHNNVNAVRSLIEPSLRRFETIAWSPSDAVPPIVEPLTAEAAQAMSVPLLDWLALG
jgi:CheY-like chemotaxis protein